MRLLNTRTLKLESFNESDIPPYAILSHTWGDDEVLFRDVVSGTIESWGGKAGARKVLEAIEAAKAMSYNYLWVDTCCIDKESSAELSEAINSMYKWYKHSKICFVYLSDVKETNFGDDFPKSRWFTRGWTRKSAYRITFNLAVPWCAAKPIIANTELCSYSSRTNCSVGSPVLRYKLGRPREQTQTC